jgi:hypothetical protein
VYADGDGIITGALIEQNTIYNNAVGPLVGAGINLDGVEDSIIRNNYIYADSGSQGIALFRIDGAVGSRNNLVANNTIVKTAEGSGVWAINISDAGCVSNRLYNNIILNANATDGSINIVDIDMPGFQSDYNIVENRFSTDEGASIMSLAEWRTHGYDQHSATSSASALFVDAATQNFHLATNSPAVDAGVFLASVSSDLDGVARPQGATHDIGCYESLSDRFRIVATAHGDGTIEPAGASLVEPGSNITYAITADAGARTVAVVLDRMTLGETNAGSPASYVFENVRTNHTIDAFFTNVFTVTPCVTGNGNVTPDGAVTTDRGGTVTFAVGADMDAHVESIRIGNVYLGGFRDTNRVTALSLTWSNVTADTDFCVDFAGDIWAFGTPATWLAGYYSETTDYETVTIEDTDADRFAAWEEWLTGTDPTDPASRFRIVGQGREGGTSVVYWLGGTSGSPDPFMVERRTNLLSPAVWNFRQSVGKSPTGTNEWRDTNAPPGAVFYRVSVTN